MAKALKKKDRQAAPLPVRVRAYLDGVLRELRLVTWPGRQQVQATTLVVLVTVFAFAVFFGVVDYVLAWGQRLLYQTFTQAG
ncbi:MAG: preprotein translocase subunit SecE [Bryobacterales bacterium]|nr:preprotein translocase subunit SecE [Bryobacterales bacterium]